MSIKVACLWLNHCPPILDLGKLPARISKVRLLFPLFLNSGSETDKAFIVMGSTPKLEQWGTDTVVETLEAFSFSVCMLWLITAA